MIDTWLLRLYYVIKPMSRARYARLFCKLSLTSLKLVSCVYLSGSQPVQSIYHDTKKGPSSCAWKSETSLPHLCCRLLQFIKAETERNNLPRMCP